MVALIVLLAVAAFVLLVVARTIRIVPQARAGVIERLGGYHARSRRGWRSSFLSSIGCAR